MRHQEESYQRLAQESQADPELGKKDAGPQIQDRDVIRRPDCSEFQTKAQNQAEPSVLDIWPVDPRRWLQKLESRKDDQIHNQDLEDYRSDAGERIAEIGREREGSGANG